MRLQFQMLEYKQLLDRSKKNLHIQDIQFMSQISVSQFRDDFYRGIQLGSGNSAKVIEITNKVTKAKYALKQIKLDNFADIASCIGEIEIIALINDDSIPKIYHYFTDGTCREKVQNGLKKVEPHIYINIIMEKCDQSLDDQIQRFRKARQRGPFIYSQLETWNFLRAMVRVFSKMQKLNFIHRDIKPANILIKYDKEKGKIYKVCDFGYAIRDSKYSSSSITGTQDFVSPRIKKKFANKDLYIAGNTAKDDVWSLGITVLHMIFPKFQGIVNQKLFSTLRSNYDEKFLRIMAGMLAQNQDYRWDFIQLERELDILFPKKHIEIIEIQNSVVEEKQQGQFSRQILDSRSSVESKPNKIASRNIEIQTQEIGVDDMIALFSQNNKKRLFQKIQSQDYNQTVYLQNPNKSSRSKQSKTQLHLRSHEFDAKNQINCIARLKDYLIVGMKGSIGILTLNLKGNCRFYVFKFNFPKSLMLTSDNFTVTQIELKNDAIAVVGTAKFFLFCKVDKFLLSLNQIVQDHDNLVIQDKIRQVKRQNIFCLTGIKQNKFQIFEIHSFNIFDLYHSSSSISHLQVVESFLNQTRVLIGHYDGIISIFGEKNIIKDQSAIVKVKFMKNKIIYSTIQGNIKIAQFTGTNIEDLKMTKTVTHFIGTIIDFEILQSRQSSSNQNVLKMIPFIRILTYQGQEITLNTNMKQIGRITVSFQEINEICESNWKWNLQGPSETGDFIVKKIFNVTKQQQNQSQAQKKIEHQKLRLFITKMGSLFDIKDRKLVYELGLAQPSSLTIDQNYLISASFDGKLKIFYTQEVLKPTNIVQKEEISQKSSYFGFTTSSNIVQSQLNKISPAPSSNFYATQSRNLQSPNLLQDSLKYFQDLKQRNFQKQSRMKKISKPN